MHTLRNYSKKTMQGYCLTCNGLVAVIKKSTEYKCIRDISTAITSKPIDLPKAARGKYEKREQAFIAKTHRLNTLYNLTWHEYLSLLDSQAYACFICTDLFTKSNPPHIDHDHSCCPDKQSCGQCVRGLLCRMCNSALGYLRDSPQACLRAYDYLTGA
jgi:hypothetical protein